VKSAHPDVSRYSRRRSRFSCGRRVRVIRFCGAEFSQGQLAFIRLAVGTIALTAVVAIYRPPCRGDVAWCWSSATASYGSPPIPCAELGEQHLDAGTAALLVNFAPILVAVSRALPRRGVSPAAVVGW